MKRTFLLSFSILSIVSCNVLNSSDGIIELNSDKVQYAVGDTVTITIKNDSRDTIFFIRRCDLTGEIESVTIEVKVDGNWKDGERPLGCAGIVPPIEIRRGEKYTFEGVFNDPGVYRYRLGLFRTDDGQHLLPEKQRRTNTFTILD